MKSIETQSENGSWASILDESSGILCSSLPLKAREIKLALPEWFVSISTEEKTVDLPSPSAEPEKPVSSFVLPEQLRDLEKEISDQFEKQMNVANAIMTKVLHALGEKDENKKLELKHLVQEKRSAVAQALKLTDELHAVRTYSCWWCKYWIAYILLLRLLVQATDYKLRARSRVQGDRTASCMPRFRSIDQAH